MATIKISQLGNVTTITGNVIVPLVANVSGTPTTLQGNVDQLKTYIIGTLSNDVANLTANAGSQDSNISSLQSNVSSLQSNVTVLQGNITTLTANAGSQANAIASITNGTATFGNLLPSANVTYDLGSASAQWKDLYLSGNTIYLGGAVVSYDGSTVAIDQPLAPFSLQVTGPSTFEGIDLHESNYGAPGTGTVALYVAGSGGAWGSEGALIVEPNNLDGNGILPSNPDMYSLGTTDYPWSAVYTGNLRFTDLSEQTTAFSQYFVDEFGNILGNVANLQIDVSTVQSDLANVQLDVATLQSDVGNVQLDVTTLQSDVGNVQLDVTTLQSDLGNVQADVGNVQFDITTLQSDLGNVQFDVTTLQSNVGNAQSEISGIQSNVIILQGDVANVQFDVANITNGTATFNNLLPSANVTYTLGNSSARWNEAYIQSTLYINDATLTSDGSTIFASGDLTVAGAVGVPYGGFLRGVTAPAGNAAVLVGPVGGGAAISATSGNIAVINSVEIGGTFANISVHNANTAVTHTWQFTEDGNLSVPGSINPTANVTYSLGSESLQWKDLWLSGNTIHIGGSEVSLTSGILSVAGKAVSTPTISLVQVTKNIGTFNPPTWSANTISGNVSVSYNSGTKKLEFTLTGFTQLPDVIRGVYERISGTPPYTPDVFTITIDPMTVTNANTIFTGFNTTDHKITYSVSNLFDNISYGVNMYFEFKSF